MSIFRPYNYKPVKGIDKNAPRKNGFFVFWEIYFRKIWRFITINIIYFLCTMPWLFYFYFMFNGYMLQFFGESMSDILPGIGFYTAIMEPIPTSLYTPILILSALLYGPLKMGVTYVYRNFAREEHAWLSDIPARGWANVKQGLFFGLLDIVVVLFLLNNIIGNFSADSDVVAILLLIARYVSIVVLVVYLFMRRYFYVMAVTVELSVIQIMKNAWLFAIIGLGRNILASLVSAAVWLATLFIIPLVTVVALPLVTFSLCGFSSVFICYPVIKKYIILPAMQAGKTDAAPGEGETPSISPEEAESQPDEADTSQENIEEK